MLNKNELFCPDYIHHPGKILQDILEGGNISIGQLSSQTGISERYIRNILNGKSGITIYIAKKLEKFFNISAEFWINLEKGYLEDKKRLNL